jgi:hypothetical protein
MRNEFLLAATAQNFRKLAKLVPSRREGARGLSSSHFAPAGHASFFDKIGP